MLTDEQVSKFQKIYREQFGKEISRERALEEGIKLVRMMKIVYQPITKEDLIALEKRRKERELKNSRNKI